MHISLSQFGVPIAAGLTGLLDCCRDINYIVLVNYCLVFLHNTHITDYIFDLFSNLVLWTSYYPRLRIKPWKECSWQSSTTSQTMMNH